MKGVTLRALLVTPEPETTVGVAAALASAREPRVITTVTPSVDDALDAFARTVPDAVVLDLGLPDAETGVARLVTVLPDTPVIALTPPDPAGRRIALVRAGVDDFLSRDADEPTVVTVLAVAVERAARRAGTNQERVARSRELDEAELRRLAPRPTTDLTGGTFGEGLLSARVPGELRHLVTEYGRILDDSLEELVMRVDRHVAARLRSLADELGALGAGPRDVVEIHTTVVEQRGRQVPALRARAYLEEGRLVVLQLMGDLLAYYRRHAQPHTEPGGRAAGGAERTQATQ